MGKTITEKILAKVSGRAEVSPGEYIEVSSRLPITLGTTMHKNVDQMKAIGHANRVFNPKLIHVVDGHRGDAGSYGAGEKRNAMREWALSVGVPEENIYDIGRAGIEHVTSGEKCWALPGEVFFQGINGHTTTMGALGAFAITTSFGTGGYLLTGKTWIQVPESARFHLTGKLPDGVFARDVFEYILAQVGHSACVGMVMEWTGPVIEEMEMDGRFCLCCNALFTGAWTGIINPDEKTLAYVRARTSEPFKPLVSDPDASYDKEFTFDLSHLVPQVVPPPKRHTAKPVSELEGTPINRGFIGSCAGSRTEDMRLAAQVLRGKQLHPGVILTITPGTRDIYKQCLKEGLLETFVDAGVVIPSPSCSMCTGGNTGLAAGDVCISTSTCNYPGRMGSEEAEIYLASPATVAASCLEGRIADPRKYL